MTNDSAIKEEVMKLMNLSASGKDDHHKVHSELSTLRKKYNDEKIVEQIYNQFKEKKKEIESKALKIKNKLITKYPNLSQKEYYDKVQGYKKKYDFTDEEFKIIMKYINNQKGFTLHGHEANNMLPFTPLSKALGYQPQNYSYATGEMSVKANQMDQLNDIIKINKITTDLHNQVQLQSLVYNDVSITAITSQVKKSDVNVYSYIHPIIVALFLPKIPALEERMLLTSLAKLIVYRKEGTPFQTNPEVMFFEDLCRDPIESLCTTEVEPFTDLLKRCTVQSQLWNAVLNLRQGKYYSGDLNQFLTAVDDCRNVTFDAPDFTHVKDLGTILRKLFGCFSFRPIVVNTLPIGNIQSSLLLNPVASLHASFQTNLPMIVVRLPAYDERQATSINLRDQISKRELFAKHKQIVAKQQDIVYCSEVLVFYVPRRHFNNQVLKINKPYSFSTLPVSTASFEKLNKTTVIFDETLVLPSMGQTFLLKSIVVVETITSKLIDDDEIIVGCSTIIKVDNESDRYLYYEPLGFSEETESSQVGASGCVGEIIHPIKRFDLGETSECYRELTNTKGSLYIYVSDKNENCVKM
jgi:hypothetical protein